MKSGIYYIQNIHNKKMYVGSAVDIMSRWRVHKSHLRNNKHCNTYLQKTWNKYGEDSIQFGILEYVQDKNMLLEREQYWINHYHSFDNTKGYNLNPIAGNMLGFHHSDKTKERLKIVGFSKGHVPWNKGKKMKGEYKENFLKAMRSEKVREARRNRIGFRHTEEAKKKIGKASKGRICSRRLRRKCP